MMKRMFFAGVFFVLTIGSPVAFGLNVADSTRLKAKPISGEEAKWIAYILDNNHYRKIKLNDSLSSAILDEYIKNLDNNRTYFTTTDLANFEKYRYAIDDLTRVKNVDAAYEIYGVFRERFDERMDLVLNHLVYQQFDFSVDGSRQGTLV
jgi:carboxyl-terminal processing protease